MSSQEATGIGVLVILVLSFFVPQGIAIGLGYEAEHAALIAWWEDLSPWSQVPLALLYGLAGFLVLAAAWAALFEIGRALLGAITGATMGVMNGTVWTVRSVIGLLVWPLHLLARALLSMLVRLFGRGPGEHFSYESEEPEWKDVDPFAQKPDPLTCAMQLLGLKQGFTKDEFETRYRTLMKGVHPDVAGPNELARQLNEARDIIRRAKPWR